MKANWWQTIVTALAMLAGWCFLWIPCVLHAWEPCVSTINPYGRTARPIDQWSWHFLNGVYGNYEDGVSGAQALIWNSTGTERVLYMPGANAAWRAYCWSAWRNSTNQLTRKWGKT